MWALKPVAMLNLPVNKSTYGRNLSVNDHHDLVPDTGSHDGPKDAQEPSHALAARTVTNLTEAISWAALVNGSMLFGSELV